MSNRKKKRMWFAILLTALFSPLGLLYVVNPRDVFIASILCMIAAVVTGGFSIFITWPGCIVWAIIETNKINADIDV